MPVDRVEPTAEGTKIEYRRAGIDEWYRNLPEGIEQGFVIRERAGWEGAIVVQGLIRGTLKAHMTPDRQSISFYHNGEEVLRYEKLLVRDSNGKRLSAKLNLEEDILRIIIDDDARYPIYIDPLVTNPAWTAEGNKAYAEFGFSVACAGDVNGDGFDDVIVGAPSYDDGQTASGRVFVYHGSESGLSTTASWTDGSGNPFDNMGFSVASAGNVNNDAYSDVIVGIPYFDNGEVDRGRVYVYYGSATGLSSWNWMKGGPHSYANFGYSVATAGDVNGDGYSDIIIGARGYKSGVGEQSEGAAYVYHGSATGLSQTEVPWMVESNQQYANFGFSVSSAGDVNNDGYSDVIIGAPYYDNPQDMEGCVFVYHGSATGLAGTPSWTWEGDQDGAQLGYCVASAGNPNQDAYSDVLFSAPFYDTYVGVDGGKFYLAMGSASGLESSAAGFMIFQLNTLFGWSIAPAGDVNNDGYPDVIVGAPAYSNGENNEGCAFLYLGNASGIYSNYSWHVEGNQPDAQLGWSVSGAGHVNDDGHADVIVGSPTYTNGEIGEGLASVYYGTPCSWQCSVHFDETYSFPPDSVFDIHPGQTLNFDVHASAGGGNGMWITVCVWNEVPDGWTAELGPAATWDWDECVYLECGYSYSYPGEILITAPDDADTLDYIDIAVFLSYCTEETTPVCNHGSLCTTDTTVCHLYVRRDPSGVEPPVPIAFRLAQNYPNPFNPITEIRYDLPSDCRVTLEIYDILGRKLVTLVDEYQEAGCKAARWNGKNENGLEISSGVYFYKLRAGNFSDTKKMVLLN